MPQSESQHWEEYLGQEVVIDTVSSYIYLGRLVRVGDWFVVLEGVDVHDRSEGASTKEKYVMDARRFGVKKNRARVSVRKELIVSFSRLEDVIEY